MDDVYHDIYALEESVRELERALSKCRRADLTTPEILAIVKRCLLTDDSILIEGLPEGLTDEEVQTVLRILYGALSPDATLSFTANRAPGDIRVLCEDIVLGRGNVRITSRRGASRVSITKVQ